MNYHERLRFIKNSHLFQITFFFLLFVFILAISTFCLSHDLLLFVSENTMYYNILIILDDSFCNMFVYRLFIDDNFR